MSDSCEIAVVGAGPYGLSIATHLRALGSNVRVVGSPMSSWVHNMPRGMLLKSAGFASSLSAPGGAYTLRDYCSERGIPYEDIDFPIPLETFCAYGLAFQQRFVPDVLDARLAVLAPRANGFELRLDNGSSLGAAKVVLAVGLDAFRHVPQALRHLPRELATHSADHHDLAPFKGRKVAVVGGGSSATDLAVLLHEVGAEVKLIARRPRLEFGEPWAGSSRSLWRRIRGGPVTGIGPGWKSFLFTQFATLYRVLPDDERIRIAKTFLGPSGGWFMTERFSHVDALLGHELLDAHAEQEGVRLQLAGPGGAQRSLRVDHVIAATGYKADVQRLGFLDTNVRERLRLIGQAPRLSTHFESSIPGLYFVGPIAATSFGPMMRFAAGADFTARTIAKRLAPGRGASQRAAQDATAGTMADSR